MIKIRILYWIYRWSRRLADYAENWADRLYAEHCSLTTLNTISQATGDPGTIKAE